MQYIIYFSLFLFSVFETAGAKGHNITRKKNATEYVYQSSRSIPVEAYADVVVIGGTMPAVAAAVKAAGNGATVFLVTSRPYLGEDICATLRLEVEEDAVFKTDLEQEIFNSGSRVTPLKVKATLNDALLDAGVDYVFSSYPTDVLWDDSGNPAGIVIANRAGRQAIIAKTIIDATERAWVARMAGAKAKDWSGDAITFERVIIEPDANNDKEKYTREAIDIPMPGLSFSAFAKAEQIARAKTYKKGQLRASESLFYVPPDPVICKKNGLKKYKNLTPKMLDYFQPEGIERMFVLSGSAGMARPMAASLLKPGALTEIGEFIGHHAAIKSKSIPGQDTVVFEPERKAASALGRGDVHEVLNGFRPLDRELPGVVSPQQEIPVTGKYDVVVVGGGTSGAPAAIGALRKGAKVLVVEYLEGLGGTGTLGLIGRPYHGKKAGFAAEVPFTDNIEPKMEWYRSEISRAGGEIMLGVIGCGAYVKQGYVKGVVLATTEGRSVVLADVVIDATGSGDIAIAAGASYMYGDTEKQDIALQGSGLPSRPLRGSYLNTDYLLVDEADMIDVWRTFMAVQITKNKENEYDAGTLIHSRERRRVVGDHIMAYLDQLAGRTYPDAIVLSGSDYDSHGYPSSPFFALLPHDEKSRKENHPAPGGVCFTPYRCLLPKGLDGILVTGLGISMDRDATAGQTHEKINVPLTTRVGQF